MLTRSRVALTTALTLVIGLAAIQAAQAASVSYIGSDGNVWITNPDGSANQRITSDATADNKYRSPSQQNDGTVVATRKVNGSTSFAFFLNPATGATKDSWLLPYRGTSGFSTFSGAQVSPPGGLIVYDYNRFELSPNTFTTEEVGFVAGSGTTNPCLINCHTNHLRPRWIPNTPYAAFIGTDLQSIDAQNGNSVVGWASTQGDELIDSFDVSSTGNTLIETSQAGGGSGAPSTLVLVEGAPPTGGVNPVCTADNFSRSIAAPRWSPDGTQIAWEDAGGVYVSPAPVVSGVTCVLQPRLIAPGGTAPGWGPANAPATPKGGKDGDKLTPAEKKQLEKLLKKCKKKHSKKAKKKCKRKAAKLRS